MRSLKMGVFSTFLLNYSQTWVNYPLAADDMDRLKHFQVLLTLRERTQLDENLFKFCASLEEVINPEAIYVSRTRIGNLT